MGQTIINVKFAYESFMGHSDAYPFLFNNRVSIGQVEGILGRNVADVYREYIRKVA